jgi:hypothetical protein
MAAMAWHRRGVEAGLLTEADADHRDELAQLAAGLRQRGLTAPALLWLAGHRPLAFVAGQTLHGLAPLGLLLGWEGVTHWATLLSAPDAAQRLTAALAQPAAAEATGKGVTDAE